VALYSLIQPAHVDITDDLYLAIIDIHSSITRKSWNGVRTKLRCDVVRYNFKLHGAK